MKQLVPLDTSPPHRETCPVAGDAAVISQLPAFGWHGMSPRYGHCRGTASKARRDAARHATPITPAQTPAKVAAGQRGAEPAHRGPCNDQSVVVGLPVSLTVLTEGLFAMLGGLAAALIVFAVAHAVTVVSLACRPQGGPAFAALTAVCRSGRPSVQRAGLYAPRVSVHLPCHAEPGQIVIGTLDCLARLNYPDFEVLVIDNNTADPEFWLPVKANPAPGCPHNKYARTPQRAGNPVPRGGPIPGIYPLERPLDQNLSEIRHGRYSRRPVGR
jgi:hypothetical protein